jgi:hypothetical protein
MPDNQENTSEELLVLLATSTDDSAELVLLAFNISALVRSAVAANSNCPPPVLCMLARDANMRVRATVASHPSSPLDTLRLLIENPKESPSVRYLALTNDSRFVERLPSMESSILNAYLTHTDTEFVIAARNELAKRDVHAERAITSL